ncbi:hypothetical protein RvY_12971 [Ramazzottius varieornatus]|uniref:BTB domain-containing protein n=1 Tax=Ramazzottius varieornatus TaxID=947166 RepID=A0A1D1VLA2_RAMVA|nr:hypothetical protein RvY_12971 [Ramazzottius varieornatus]
MASRPKCGSMLTFSSCLLLLNKCVGNVVAESVEANGDTLHTVRALYTFIRNGISASEISVEEEPIDDFMLELLNNPKLKHLADVQFLVGKQIFSAHKAILAGRSVIFNQMLYSSTGTTISIDVPPNRIPFYEVNDLQPETFQLMLEFLYTKQLLPPNTTNILQVLDLVYAGYKYVLPSLINKTLTVVGKNIRPSNVIEVLDRATEMDQKTLMDKCWTLIRRDAVTIISSKQFLRFDITFMKKLLYQDNLLGMSEAYLFNRVVEWAKQRVPRPDLSATSETYGVELRRVLEPVIYDFRFLSMTGEEFASGPCESGVLTKDEQLEILLSINSKDNGKNWKTKFSTLTRGKNGVYSD